MQAGLYQRTVWRGSERRNRQTYHACMHTSHDLELIRVMGFSEAMPCHSPSWWSDQEVAAVLECLRGLASEAEAIHTADPFYLTFHHTLLLHWIPV